MFVSSITVDLVQRGHSRIHVVVNVAMEHPDARVVGNHVHSFHLRLHKRNDVRAFAVVQYDVAVPVRSVHAELFPKRDQIPANTFAFLHGHHWAGPVDVAVDRELGVGNGEARTHARKIALVVHRGEFEFLHSLRIAGEGLNVVVEVPTDVFVKQHEEADEFAVHIFRLAVSVRHPSPGDDHRADQSAFHIFQLLCVRVVEPDDRTGIVRSGTCAFWNLPYIGMSFAGRHGIVFFVWLQKFRRRKARLRSLCHRKPRADACCKDAWRCS